jgi:hypothetical protein
LLAVDLDGTLVDHTMEIRPRVRSALRRAMEAGVQVTLASGRPFTHTALFAQQLGIDTPLICFQGALVQEPGSREILFRCGVPAALAGEFIDLARAQQWSLSMYMDDGLYAERVTPLVRFFAQYSPIAQLVIAVDDLHALLSGEPMKLIVVAEEGQATQVNKLLKARFDGRLRIVRSFECFVEGTSLAASKGQALAFLAAKLGVTQAETMAIGDQDNDADMVAWAGLGVAMGNASPAVKARANYVAPPFDEDGVAEAVECFILEGRADE